jgi:hypothetical protein
MQVSFRGVEDCEKPILEDLCSTCLFAVRLSQYGGGDEKLNFVELGVGFDHDEDLAP